jgi:hypothetical protein
MIYVTNKRAINGVYHGKSGGPTEAKKSLATLLKRAGENDVAELDIRFTDIRGMVQPFSMPLPG